MQKRDYKDVFPMNRPLMNNHRVCIKTNEYFGRNIRNSEEAGAMDYAEMFTKNNDEGWPYAD